MFGGLDEFLFPFEGFGAIGCGNGLAVRQRGSASHSPVIMPE